MSRVVSGQRHRPGPRARAALLGSAVTDRIDEPLLTLDVAEQPPKSMRGGTITRSPLPLPRGGETLGYMSDARTKFAEGVSGILAKRFGRPPTPPQNAASIVEQWVAGRPSLSTSRAEETVAAPTKRRKRAPRNRVTLELPGGDIEISSSAPISVKVRPRR